MEPAYRLGQLLSHDGKAVEALQEFQKAVDRDSQNKSYHYALARALKAAGRDGEAQSEFAKVQALTERERGHRARPGAENASGIALAEQGKATYRGCRQLREGYRSRSHARRRVLQSRGCAVEIRRSHASFSGVSEGGRVKTRLSRGARAACIVAGGVESMAGCGRAARANPPLTAWRARDAVPLG